MAPCKSACSRRMPCQLRAFSVLATLLLWTVLVHSGPVPTPSWDPGFKATQVGGQVVVAIYHPYKNASAYKLMLTHSFYICQTKVINDSEVGMRIKFDVPVNKCGKPVRVGVIALTKNNEELTKTVETLLTDPPVPEANATTTAPLVPESEPPGAPSSSPLPFTLLACVLAAVVVIAASLGLLFFWRHRGEGSCPWWSVVPGSSEPNGPVPTWLPLEMHPIYLAGHDTVTVTVELLMELLCAHANVLVRPYRDSEDAIRSNPTMWLDRRTKLPCILFRSPGLSRRGLSAETSDHYGVVKPALTMLNNSQNLIEVDVITDEARQHNNDSGARSGGSEARLVLDFREGADVRRDFERLVKEIHRQSERDYPFEQMENWWDCRIFQHLLEQIRCRHNNVERERVSCRCRIDAAGDNRENNQEANALLG